MKLDKHTSGVGRWLKMLRLRKRGDELTADQIAYLHERAEERRQRWKEHDAALPPGRGKQK